MPSFRNLCPLLVAYFLFAPHVLAQSFVQRSGTHLTMDGAPFRFSGPNVEWLGLEGYGPHDPFGPRYPSRFEIDDAMDTAAERRDMRTPRSWGMADGPWTVRSPKRVDAREARAGPPPRRRSASGASTGLGVSRSGSISPCSMGEGLHSV